MKKLVTGSLLACMVLGGAFSAFAATDAKQPVNTTTSVKSDIKGIKTEKKEAKKAIKKATKKASKKSVKKTAKKSAKKATKKVNTTKSAK